MNYEGSLLREFKISLGLLVTDFPDPGKGAACEFSI